MLTESIELIAAKNILIKYNLPSKELDTRLKELSHSKELKKEANEMIFRNNK